YWSLGIHDPDFKDDSESFGDDRRTAVQKILYAKALWAVLSFRSVSETDSVMAEAWQQANSRPASGPFYRVHVYRWGKETPAPNDMYRVRGEVLEEAIDYVAGAQ